MARIHVAGNTVLDVVVPGVPLASPGADSWGANVQLLREPVTAVLGGCGANRRDSRRFDVLAKEHAARRRFGTRLDGLARPVLGTGRRMAVHAVRWSDIAGRGAQE